VAGVDEPVEEEFGDDGVGEQGVMYVLDDDLSYIWERWVMRRGTVYREVDMSLSPHVGVVEDLSSP
jgi:hypothetical protein